MKIQFTHLSSPTTCHHLIFPSLNKITSFFPFLPFQFFGIQTITLQLKLKL